MKLYKAQNNVIIEKDSSLYILEDQNWDSFVNDDFLYSKVTEAVRDKNPDPGAADLIARDVQAPLQNQEIWACGVTYYSSKIEREEESKDAGGGDFYDRVYTADRPEIFFKATAYRTAGPGGKVKIRKDSVWNVPEPELTLVVTSSGKIVGYTIGNDMSSRSIEGENPLYLPQAKTYDRSAAVGPCIYVAEEPLPPDTTIQMEIYRSTEKVFEGTVEIKQMKRTPAELVSWLYRECSFPHGCLLMTGTGIIPPGDFTLQKNDEIRITMEPVGTLINRVG